MLPLPIFRYHRPRTLPEAIALLAELGDNAKIIAGGTDLLPNMKHGLFEPEHVVSVSRLEELRGIRLERVEDGGDGGERLSVGAGMRLAEIAENYGSGQLRLTPWQNLILLLIYFVLAYVMVACLMASIGADGATDAGRLGAELDRIGVRRAGDDTWSDMLSRVLSEKVEPKLGLGRVTILDHYPAAEAAFREIARLTGGAWCRFDMGSAAQLRELLRAAAAYAAGGRDALMRLAKSASGAAALLGQMK